MSDKAFCECGEEIKMPSAGITPKSCRKCRQEREKQAKRDGRKKVKGVAA
jgi:hypothetical protein